MPRELTIDIHGQYVEDALAEVREFVRRAPKEAERINQSETCIWLKR